MGHGSDQPYIYPSCAPLSERRLAFPYSNFNPKATTQAAYQAIYDQNRPRPRQDGPLLRFDQPVSSYMVVSGDKVNYTPAAYEALQAKKRTKPEGNGPLINFNQHPDSWQVVSPNHRVEYKPMPANTKVKVTAIRWVQFCLRVLEELGAMGILVCMICFKNMPTSFSLIMRIAPAWDILVTLYAIYHLIRPARARTAASSASYHIFALVNDVGLLPFYIYICLNARQNYRPQEPGQNGWGSLFDDDNITTKLLLTAFIGTATIAGLHLVSAILDLWLIVLFKTIAKLPPDVNPLEDNLTSRASRRSKHKYKNSEATLTDSLSEKNPAYLSGSTLSVDQTSHISTPSRDLNEAGPRKIPFDQTRARSAAPFSPRGPEAARLSRENFEDVKLYKQPDSARNSRTAFESPSRTFDKELSHHASSPSPKDVIPWPTQSSERFSRPSSYPVSDQGTDVTDFARVASPAVPNAAPSTAIAKSQQKTSLLNDNWYVIDDGDSDLGAHSRPFTPAVEHPTSNQSNIPYLDSVQPQPLKMNPPTPPLKDAEYPDPANEDVKYQPIKRKPLASRADNGNGDLNRNLTVQSNSTTTSSVYSDDDQAIQASVRSGTPKGKYYGDLTAATRGVLGTKSKATRGFSYETTPPTATLAAGKMENASVSALSGFTYGFLPGRRNSQSQNTDSRSRVISRTGVDIADAANEDASFGIRGRRDVSGKVAEEGRGGAWWSRKVY